MKLNKFASQKKTAQAMVEFAIVLPILLLLLYGLLEAGRLLFMYSTIVTASRQAVRYGAATGDGTTPGVARYDDCTGIRQAANKVDYLNAFDHTSIDVMIGWDNGGGSVNWICPTGQAKDGWKPNGNEDRLIVTVTGHFHPIVPKLVPFANRDIEATSRRTILTGVDIVVPTAVPAAPTIDFVDSTAPTNTSDVGQDVTFTVTLSGPSGVPTGTVAFSVNGIPIGGLCLPGTVNGAGVATCTITFNTPGPMLVEAKYSGDSVYAETSPPPITHTVGKAVPNITIDGPGWSHPGEAVTYTIHVKNPNTASLIPTGTVNITSTPDGGSCSGVALDPSGSASCTFVFNTELAESINVSYSGDANHQPASASRHHDVMIADATATNTPLPTNTPTETPIPTATPLASATPMPTFAVTPVTECNLIQNAGGIQFNDKTMYLNILNPNTYDVVVNRIYVVWNWDNGRIGGDGNLWLKSIQLGTTEIWAGNLNEATLTIPSDKAVFSTIPIIPGGGTTTLTFTFAHKYSNKAGEEINIYFATPGCESDAIHVKN